MVTIGTWNLENLFRPGDDSAPEGSQEYESKLDALASTITDLAPDVLAVQEVGDPSALNDLAGQLKGTWRTALAEPDARGIRVGFLSKSALTKVGEISDFPDGLSPVQVDDEAERLSRWVAPRSKHVSEKAARRSTSSQSTSNLNCCRTPAVDSRPGMKANVLDTPFMLSTDEQQRHPQSAPERSNCSVVTDARTEPLLQAISMMNLRLPRRRFCSALVARSSARPASIGLTRVMLIECGTWNS